MRLVNAVLGDHIGDEDSFHDLELATEVAGPAVVVDVVVDGVVVVADDVDAEYFVFVT